MRHVTRPRRSRTILAALLGAGLLTLGAPALAAAACTPSSSSKVFEQFGDGAAYSLAPGGSFETGTSGWKLSNAAVVDGNETFQLTPGSHSLAIATAGSAVSPWVCISSEYPSFRFVARQLSGSPTEQLHVSLRWLNLLGITVNTTAGTVQSSSTWTPTPVLVLGSSVPLWLPGTSLNVALVFSTSGQGAWAIDDVYIDPYSR
jgi:hypothetical protein